MLCLSGSFAQVCCMGPRARRDLVPYDVTCRLDRVRDFAESNAALCAAKTAFMMFGCAARNQRRVTTDNLGMVTAASM